MEVNRKGSEELARARAFTLVEILIVVVLLGVMAAIVIPAFAGAGNLARQSTLSMNLNLLRRFVPVYTSHHLEVQPGYPGGDRTADPTEQAFVDQATLASTMHGATAPRGTVGFPLGPYISNVPPNPFNKLATVKMLGNGEAFPANPDNSTGWIYKAATGELRPNDAETDPRGTRHYDY